MKDTNDWRLEGSYFEACNCETACPCVWFNAPSEGDCKLLVAWHIDKGHFQQLQLDDLNIALACYSPGHMREGNWQAALYVDARSNAAQFDAITQIFSGQSGGHLAVLMSFVGEVLGIKKVPIDYQEHDDNRRLTIPGITSIEIESIQGISGAPATIDNPPLCIVPSHPATVAKSSHYHYQDYDKNWQFSDRNGYYSPFIYHA